MYNTYEEYMQNVLGMNTPNTYAPNINYYEPRMQEPNLLEINNLYPEIYGIIYPMVQKTCSRRNIITIDEMQINEMVDEIYNAVEANTEVMQTRETTNNIRAQETKNTREKETRRPSNNYLLRDLIRILIIREILQGGNRPNMPRPPVGPGMPYPGGPGMPGGRPPIIRSGFMG